MNSNVKAPLLVQCKCSCYKSTYDLHYVITIETHVADKE